MQNEAVEKFEKALQQEHIREAKLAVGQGLARAFDAMHQMNGVRPGEKMAPGSERWTIIGAAEYLNAAPEDIRQAMAATGVVYIQVLDGVGQIDTPALLAVARWLKDNGK